eukprot:TRINITY_DN40237_c0_g1_i1.p1 TRINITY_DN40237_c0_g1~~TRINITY_DN40237_c0_g1_i1.p1  ORF type:complete len:311 (+),score=44.26 TRINITY_DN40237_c0_g1_i1:449-1381(+)
MSRALIKSKIFALKRSTFGKKLCENELHLELLLNLEACYRSCLFFTLDLAMMLGETERRFRKRRHANVGNMCQSSTTGFTAALTSTELESLLRFCTPMAKLYTAKHSVQLNSELLECLGGLGYLETSEMPRLLRDSQVLPVWEGTTNVCALDIFRVLTKSRDFFSLFEKFTRLRTANTKYTERMLADLGKLKSIARAMQSSQSSSSPPRYAREFAYSISRFAASLSLIGVACSGVEDPAGILEGELLVDTFLEAEDLRSGAVVSQKLMQEYCSDEEGSRNRDFPMEIAQRLLFGDSEGTILCNIDVLSKL